MDERCEERRRMVEQFVSRGLRNEAVLAAMRTVPREAFIAAELAEFAYEDAPLPIEAGQTISQPYIVAAMTAALELTPRDRVLEIGTGSGYAAAVLSRIADEVYTVRRDTCGDPTGPHGSSPWRTRHLSLRIVAPLDGRRTPATRHRRGAAR